MALPVQMLALCLISNVGTIAIAIVPTFECCRRLNAAEVWTFTCRHYSYSADFWTCRSPSLTIVSLFSPALCQRMHRILRSLLSSFVKLRQRWCWKQLMVPKITFSKFPRLLLFKFLRYSDDLTSKILTFKNPVWYYFLCGLLLSSTEVTSFITIFYGLYFFIQCS